MLWFLDGFEVLVKASCCFDHDVLGALRQFSHHHTCTAEKAHEALDNGIL